MDNENVNNEESINEGYRRFDNASSLSSMPHFNYNDENSNVSKAIQKNRTNRTYQKPSYNNEEGNNQENTNNTNDENEFENNEVTENDYDSQELEESNQAVEEKNKVVEELKEKAKKAVKAKVRTVLLAAVPSLGGIILFVTILLIFLLPVIYLNQYIDKIKTGAQEFGDKMLNFLTFNGWETSASSYTKQLTKITNDYDKFRYKENNFDVSIINSTIFALKTSNPENIEVQLDSSDSYEGGMITTVNGSDKSFYTWAKAWLGDIEKIFNIKVDIFNPMFTYISATYGIDVSPSLGSGLAGNLVNYYIGYDCIEEDENTVGSIAKQFKDAIDVDISVGSLEDLGNYLKDWFSFKDLEQDYNGAITLSQKYANISSNPFKKLYDIAKSEKSQGEKGYYGNSTCPANTKKIPALTAYIDYEGYEEYLKEVYIPATYFLCNNCTYKDRYSKYLISLVKDDSEKAFFDSQVDEIYDTVLGVKSIYDDTYGPVNSSGYTFLEQKKYGNNKVIINLDNDNSETLTLEEYIKGVTYNYVIDNNITNEEVIKATMIAIRSNIVAKSSNSSEISIKNKKDPVFCNMDKGCYYDTELKSYVSGKDADGNYYKKPASKDISDLINKLYNTVDDVVVLGKDNNTLLVNVTDSLIKKFNTYSYSSDINYNQILISSVSNAKTLSNSYNTGEYIYWSQWDAPWKNQFINPGYGSETMHHNGCVITAVAILMAKSGTKINVTPFNPGIFASYMAKYTNEGYYAWCKGGGKICFRWNAAAATGLAPNFLYVGAFDLTGSAQQKINQIREYYNQGYYVAIRVASDGHSVALDHIEGNKVFIIDPSSNNRTGVVELTKTKYGYTWDTTWYINVYKKVD